MNEFVAKKLGEVLAFSNIGAECRERGGDAFAKAVGQAEAETFGAELQRFAETASGKGNDITTGKAEKTTAKLRGMMEAYIGDEWDNPVELLEWLSFFLGSAAAHWALVAGAAATIDDTELEQAANDASAFYKMRLEAVMGRLREFGSQKASS